MDQFTETTSQSGLSRITGSIKGVLVGVVLIAAAFILLWWNEGRAVTTARSLDEGESAVVSVAADRVDPAHEGTLVHVSGVADTEQVLRDKKFKISVTALHLSRSVAMFQWTETQDRETQKKLGGGTETVTTYSYDTEWRESLVDSKHFRQAEQHENPKRMPVSGHRWSASDVTLGAFTLPDSLVGRIANAQPIPATEDMVAKLPRSLRKRAQVLDGEIYVGSDPSNPAVGDLRIRFSQTPPCQVSVVAQQVGGGLGPYPTKAGRMVELLEMGSLSAPAMFAQAQQRNAILTWCLRGLGLILMVMGIGMVFGPLVAVADVVPILGDILGVGVFLVALLAGSALSLVTISIAWIVYRPLLGIALLVGGAGAFVALKMLAKARRGQGSVGSVGPVADDDDQRAEAA